MVVDPRVGTSREGEVQAEFLAEMDAVVENEYYSAEEESEVDAGEGSGATGVIGEGGQGIIRADRDIGFHFSQNFGTTRFFSQNLKNYEPFDPHSYHPCCPICLFICPLRCFAASCRGLERFTDCHDRSSSRAAPSRPRASYCTFGS